MIKNIEIEKNSHLKWDKKLKRYLKNCPINEWILLPKEHYLFDRLWIYYIDKFYFYLDYEHIRIKEKYKIIIDDNYECFKIIEL